MKYSEALSRWKVFLFMFFILSCTPNNTRRDYEQLKSNRIILPEYDITEEENPLVAQCSHRKLKLIVFTDSTSCNSCSIERIYDWSELIEYAERYNGQLSYYFIFTPKKSDIEDVLFALNHTTSKYPLILDSLGLFRTMNPHIPANKLFHTFLLNEENRVIMVGNPLHNSDVRKLFEDLVEENLSKK